MYNILLMVQIVVALAIISLVLIQHGKGADAGAAFGGGGAAGGGASGSVFGSRGAGNFLSRTTAILALVFFLNSLALAWLVSHRDGTGGSIISDSASPISQIVAPSATGDVPEVPDSETVTEGAVPEATTGTKPTSDVPEATAPTSAASTGEASANDASDKSTKE